MNREIVQGILTGLLMLIMILLAFIGFYIIFTFVLIFFNSLLLSYPTIYSFVVFGILLILVTIKRQWNDTWMIGYNFVGRIMKKFGLGG